MTKFDLRELGQLYIAAGEVAVVNVPEMNFFAIEGVYTGSSERIFYEWETSRDIPERPEADGTREAEDHSQAAGLKMMALTKNGSGARDRKRIPD